MCWRLSLRWRNSELRTRRRRSWNLSSVKGECHGVGKSVYVIQLHMSVVSMRRCEQKNATSSKSSLFFQEERETQTCLKTWAFIQHRKARIVSVLCTLSLVSVFQLLPMFFVPLEEGERPNKVSRSLNMRKKHAENFGIVHAIMRASFNEEVFLQQKAEQTFSYHRNRDSLFSRECVDHALFAHELYRLQLGFCSHLRAPKLSARTWDAQKSIHQILSAYQGDQLFFSKAILLHAGLAIPSKSN